MLMYRTIYHPRKMTRQGLEQIPPMRAAAQK